MAYQYQGPTSPSDENEVMWEQPTSSTSVDNNGQHNTQFFFLNEQQCLLGPQDYPVPGFPILNDSCADIITHLDDFQHLKDNRRECFCPGCRQNVGMPGHACPGYQAAGHGKEAILEIKSSDEFLSHYIQRMSPSSAGSSPISPLSSNSGASEEKGQALPMPHSAVNNNFNAGPQITMSQHSRSFCLGPINTQCSSMHVPIYEMAANQSYTSPTATNLSFGSGPDSLSSAQVASSATSFSQPAWPPTPVTFISPTCLYSSSVPPSASVNQPPGDAQHLEALAFGPMLSQHSDKPSWQDTPDMDGMKSDFALDIDPNINFINVGNESPGDFPALDHDPWSQQEEHSPVIAETPDNPTQEDCAGQELASEAEITDNLSSPASTDNTMPDTPATSEGSSPPTSDSPHLVCRVCKWTPKYVSKRTPENLKLALEKHINRNHQGKDYDCNLYYKCPMCNQTLKNRRDNVKPHIQRKHPKKFEEMYGKMAQQDCGPRGSKKRRTSMPFPSDFQALPHP